MFGGNPFNVFRDMDRQMARHMREVNRMMGGLMDPFEGFRHDGTFAGMEEGGGSRYGPSRRRGVVSRQTFSSFGGGLFESALQGMQNIQSVALSDPNAQVFVQSTSVTYDGREGGQPRIVERSMRRTGDVQETRESLRLGNVGERISIAHTIGDRTHAIEKRRDRDGRIREQQRFINLRQDEAVEFDREFTSRVRRSLGGGSVQQQRAIEYVAGSASAGHAMGTGRSNAQAKDMSNAPVVTMPDDEKSDLYDSSHHAHSFRKHGDARAPRVGPIIKEVHDEEIRTDERRHKKCMRGRFSNARND